MERPFLFLLAHLPSPATEEILKVDRGCRGLFQKEVERKTIEFTSVSSVTYKTEGLTR